MSAKLLDDIHVGDRFGKCTVLCIKTRKRSQRYAECLCDCFRTFEVPLTDLRCNRRDRCPSCAMSKAWIRIKRLSADELILRRAERNYKKGASIRNLEWSLDQANFRRLYNAPCHYCGTEFPDGIDRQNNKLGYTLENCVPCCILCNRAKMAMPLKQFMDWVARLAIHQGFTL